MRYNRRMSVQQRLDAVFFRSKSGNEPVREWLKELPKQQRKAIGEDIAYVQFKWPIGKPRIGTCAVRCGRFVPRSVTVLPGRSSRYRAGRWYFFMDSSREHNRHPTEISIWLKNASRS